MILVGAINRYVFMGCGMVYPIFVPGQNKVIIVGDLQIKPG